MVAHWLYDDFMIERSRRPRALVAWWCAVATYIALRSRRMITVGFCVMGFFLALGLLQTAFPGETTLLQYGALGAMCVFLGGLLVWTMRVGLKIFAELREVVEKNTATLAEVREVLRAFTRGRDGD